MRDHLRIIGLFLLLVVLMALYFALVHRLSATCVEIGHYTNGQPIFDCTKKLDIDKAFPLTWRINR